MSTTVQLPQHPWASAHRLLLTVMATALTLAVALTIAFVVLRTTGDETGAPGAGVNSTPSQRVDPTAGFPHEHCLGHTCAR